MKIEIDAHFATTPRAVWLFNLSFYDIETILDKKRLWLVDISEFSGYHSFRNLRCVIKLTNKGLRASR